MICKDCEYLGSDSVIGGGTWHICIHPDIIKKYGFGQEPAVYLDKSPEWGPLKRTKEKKDD